MKDQDGHSNRETPVPIPNTEVKPFTLCMVLALVGKYISCPAYFLKNEEGQIKSS